MLPKKVLYDYIITLVLGGANDEFIKSFIIDDHVSDEEITEAIVRARSYEENHPQVNLPVTDPNKFMKILIACGVDLERLKDYEWSIQELRRHEYQCTGVHPVAARIDLFKRNVIIH